MIPVTCEECDKSLRVKDEHAGKRIKCPGCGAVLVVPTPDEEVEEAVQTRPSRKPSRKPRPDEDDEVRPRKKKKRKGDEDDDAAGKPNVIFLVAGLVLALGGLVSSAAFIYFTKQAKDEIGSAEYRLDQLRRDVAEAGRPKDQADSIRQNIDREQKTIDGTLKPKVTRNILLAIVFGVVFFVGAGLRGYHHFAMKKWHREHHGLDTKGRREESDQDDEDD